MYDVIVIGAGPGGMTAAMYAARANLNVAIIEQGLPGGQMNNTDIIDNYPGFVSIKGRELSQKMHENVTANNIEEIRGAVAKVEVKADDIKEVQLTDGNSYQAKVIIIATGAVHRSLNVPGEDKFAGYGVSYCALCDGAFFRDRDVLVVGGGNAAIEESLYLSQLVKSVTIIHRREELRAFKNLQEKAFATDNISFIYDTVVDEVLGDQMMTGVRARNVKTNEETIINGDGLFIYVGMQPNTEPFGHLGITDEHGWISTNEKMETVIPGVFALGDVRKKELRQITTAVSEGTIAGQQAFYYIEGIG